MTQSRGQKERELSEVNAEWDRCEKEWASNPRENSIARDARADKRKWFRKRVAALEASLATGEK